MFCVWYVAACRGRGRGHSQGSVGGLRHDQRVQVRPLPLPRRRYQRRSQPRLKPGKVLVGSGDEAIFKKEKIDALLASYKRGA